MICGMEQTPSQFELYPSETFEPRDEHMLKHVNAVALVPTEGGRPISYEERKLFNVLLHRAQTVGAKDEYSAGLHEIIKDIDYGSKDTTALKKSLKNLMKTVVEWQSPTSGEISEEWGACVLLSGASIKKDKVSRAVTLLWRYDIKVREQLLSPDRYARLVMESIVQLRTHAAIALYEICARYVDNPGHKTARQHWHWWKLVMSGKAKGEQKGEFRYWKRDVLTKAIAEINTHTELEITKSIEFKERDNKTISDLQFEVRLKSSKPSQSTEKKPLDKISEEDMPLIGWALKMGIKQADAEKLLRQHGAEEFKDSLGALEKRLAVPKEVTDKVQSPSAYLRSILRSKASSKAKEIAAKPINPLRSAKDSERSKAALTEEWLRGKKDALRAVFSEMTETAQAPILANFREMLIAQLPSMVKRFDGSGWGHKMLRDNFASFLGESWEGTDWNKPSMDELLNLALEKANLKA